MDLETDLYSMRTAMENALSLKMIVPCDTMWICNDLSRKLDTG